MRVIGLDLASTTGFAWTDDGVVRAAQSGTVDFSLRHYEGGGLRVLRAERFFAQLVPEDGPCRVFFETPVWRPARAGGPSKGDQGAGAVIFGELSGALMRVCELAGIPFEGLNVTIVKKHATGKGNASKDLMIKAAQKSYGLAAASHDQADALHVLSLGLKLLSPPAAPQGALPGS